MNSYWIFLFLSFRAPEPRQPQQIRPSRSERKKTHHPHHQSSTGVLMAARNKENTQFIPRPKIPLDPYNLATNDPSKFAEKLFAKLSKIEDEQFKESKLRGILELNRTRSSIHDHTHDHDLESDQSILDEHVDRVFNEDNKTHNVSAAFNQFEGSNRHLSASFSVGYRTLDTSRHHSQSHFGKS